MLTQRARVISPESRALESDDFRRSAFLQLTNVAMATRCSTGKRTTSKELLECCKRLLSTRAWKVMRSRTP